MTVTIATAGWNESKTILPVIRYYLDICKFDKFIYFDNYSEDDTIQKINDAYANDIRVIILNTPYTGHKPVEETCLMNTTMEQDDSDVFIWIDSDEILYCKDFQKHFLDLVNQEKFYSATYMSNVYNDTNSFEENKLNIVDNFKLVCTDTILKTPIIVKTDKHTITFGGGHHSINKDGIDFGNCEDNPKSPGLKDLHLFHFTYITAEMYYNRKTLGRFRNLNLNIDNSWYHDYWNLSLADVQNMIDYQKTISKSITEYL